MLRPSLFPLIVSLALSAPLAGSAGAAESLPSPASAPSAPVVVELFTSQGCSSCPPADAFLSELAQRPGVIALAFHVDYWNYIGWTDPFAKPWATARQRAYREALNQRFVYTPEMVVDGAAQAAGNDRAAVESLIGDARAHPPAHPSLALFWRKDGALAVDVGAGASPPGEPATLWLIGYDKARTTQVLRGENEGRALTDVHPVRSYRALGKWAGWSAEFIVPAADVKTLGNGGIAVLLQERGAGPILNAAQIAQR